MELGHSNNPKEPYTKQRHVNKMFGSFLSKLNGEMLPLEGVYALRPNLRDLGLNIRKSKLVTIGI